MHAQPLERAEERRVISNVKRPYAIITPTFLFIIASSSTADVRSIVMNTPDAFGRENGASSNRPVLSQDSLRYTLIRK
jgi:hypothetical protein